MQFQDVNPKRTEISELGEFQLIDQLTGRFPILNPSTRLGVGDDCAILNFAGNDVLVSSDILLEGIHFDLSYTPLLHLGYKAATVNFSDICAMNAKPTQLIVSIGLSKRFSVEDVATIYDGLALACEEYGVDLVGGDTSSSLTGLCLSLTCIGEAKKGQAVRRSGAKPTDLLCVSGNLGAAYMGLQLLEREKKVFQGQQDFTPDFEGKEYLLERQLRPKARWDIVQALAKAGITPTSMIDISDGLSSEILHLCQRSSCGCRLYEERIPIDYQTASLCEEMNLNLTTAALNGGEDYELLFTAPLGMRETLEGLEDVHLIGYMTSADEGARLITREGSEIEIVARGWNHLHN